MTYLNPQPSHRRPYRWLLASAVCWFLLVLFVESDTGGSAELLSIDIVVPLGGLILMLWVFLALLVIVIRFVRHRTLPHPRQRLLVYPFVILLLLGARWLEHTHQAVLWRIKLNEAPLIAFIQEQKGIDSDVSRHVGLFYIERTEGRGDTVWMVTKECSLFGNECGLVYSPGGKPPRIPSSEDHYGHLDGPWWIWMRSW